MKPFLNTQTCWISTLTPVHIGSGEDYYPSNYVIDGGVLYHFGDTGLLAALDGNELKQLAQLAERRGDDGIQQLQAFIHGRKGKLREIADHAVPVADGVAQLYAARIGQTAQREGGGRNVQNKLAIQRSAYNPLTQTSYLPGSSIKGAIRTAILDFLNRGEPLPPQERGTSNKPVKNAVNRDLQGRLLGYPPNRIPDDPLRLLQVADASYAHADGLHGLEIRFAVNRKNKPSKQQSKAEQQNLYQLLECVAPNRIRAFELAIGLHDTLKDEFRFGDPAELALVCNSFYRPLLEKELHQLANLNLIDGTRCQSLQRLLAGELGQALDGKRAFLLRVGRHSGAESLTLNGVRHIHIPQKKMYSEHTSTVWLAADSQKQQHSLMPFGWLLVELPGCELPQTHAFLKQQAERDYRLLEQEQARQALVRQAKAEEERSRAEAEARRHEAEQRQRAEQERLAAMSEAARQVEAFRQRMDREKSEWIRQGVGGAWFQSLRALAEQAAGWPPEDRAALHTLVRDIGGLDARLSPKKNDKIKALVRQLAPAEGGNS